MSLILRKLVPAKQIVILFLIPTIVLLYPLKINAQVANQFNSWWYYNGNYKVASKINLQSMYSWNRYDFAKEWQQSNLKFGAGFEINKKLTLSSGYEWVVLFPYGAYPVAEKRNEHRLYEQIKIKLKYKQTSIESSVLAEQRFIKSDLIHGIRSQVGIKFPIWKKDTETRVGIYFYDQVLLNLDRKLLGQNFSQNRLYGGLDIYLDKSLILNIGYLNHYIALTKNRAENNNTFMLGISHSIDFTKNH